MISNENICLEAFNLGLKPDSVLTVSEWADEYRILPQKASAEPGKWRTERTPYLREIMDCLSPSHPAEKIVWMKAAQVGATEAGLNWMGYVIHQAPAPMMIIEPTVDLAKRLSKQRIAPSIEETPVLRERVKMPRERDSGNTLFAKEFKGGIIILTGANSAVGLRSMPVKYLFLDEVDGYPQDVEGEGDPVSLAVKRTTTFSRSKIYEVSTPTIKGLSRIETDYESSDKRKYYVLCPYCKTKQTLQWSGIKFEYDERYKLKGDVKYECRKCKKLISESYKTWMLENGQWKAEVENNGKIVGFHLSALYAPIGWISWKEIVEEFLEAKRLNDELRLKTWVNTVLAETWEEKGETIDDNDLFSRREDYGLEIPMDAVVLTCGVDVQDSYLVAEVVAWGRDKESWSIEYEHFYGDPTRQDVWNSLDAFLQKKYPHESGAELMIACTCIDSGYKTQNVYDFVKKRQMRRIYAVKGSNQAGMPIVNSPKSKTKEGILLFSVGTDTAKTDIYSYLKIRQPGPAYMHFPVRYNEEYFKMLTAEKVVTRYHRGFPMRVWEKPAGKRNEALDVRVYALAAYYILNPNIDILSQNLTQTKKTQKQIIQKPIVIRSAKSLRQGWLHRWR